MEKSPKRFQGGRLSKAAAWEGSTLMTTTPLPSPAAGAPLFEGGTILPSPEISPTAMTPAGRAGEFGESPRFEDEDVALGAARVGAAAIVLTRCHWAGLEVFASMGSARWG